MGMKLFKAIYAATSAALLIGGLWGCGTSNQSEDAKINAEVQTSLDQQASLEAPNIIEVQTLNSIVYLDGRVRSDLQRLVATELALEVPGVMKVVNSIALEK
jgi:osmotically-inducible protein OsmY